MCHELRCSSCRRQLTFTLILAAWYIVLRCLASRVLGRTLSIKPTSRKFMLDCRRLFHLWMS